MTYMGFGIMSPMFLLMLTGCATVPKVETQIVKVEVPVRCKATLPEKPIEYTKNVTAKDPLLVKANAFIAENKERKAYEIKLEATISECIDAK